MIELSATIQNAHGIHCRPSAVVIKAAAAYPGSLLVTADNGQCDLRSVMQLIALGLHQGAQVRIRVEGPDEDAFCRQLVGLFETRFDFPPRTEPERPLEADGLRSDMSFPS
jgi:phosphocarrier protein HPr